MNINKKLLQEKIFNMQKIRYEIEKMITAPIKKFNGLFQVNIITDTQYGLDKPKYRVGISYFNYSKIRGHDFRENTNNSFIHDELPAYLYPTARDMLDSKWETFVLDTVGANGKLNLYTHHIFKDDVIIIKVDGDNYSMENSFTNFYEAESFANEFIKGKDGEVFIHHETRKMLLSHGFIKEKHV